MDYPQPGQVVDHSGADHAAGPLSHPEPSVAGHNAALALALLRALPDSVYLMDPDGRVTFMNRAAAACLNAVPASGEKSISRGRSWWELWPAAAESELRNLLALAREGESSELALLCPGRGGQTVSCHVTLAPIEDLNGEITKLLCIARER